MPDFNTNDAFSPKRITPTYGIPDELLLFENMNGGENPLQPISTPEGNKILQMTIFVLYKGQVNLRVNGKEVTVNAGETITTYPDSEIHFISASSDDRYQMFVIYPQMLMKVCDDIYLKYDVTEFQVGFVKSKLSESQMQQYKLLFNELRKECIRPAYEYRMISTRAYLNSLLVKNLNVYGMTNKVEVDPTSRQFDVYQKFLELLNLHVIEERTVKFYADELGISPKYLSYVSLQYSNKNASQWIGEYVVSKAKTFFTVHHMNTIQVTTQLHFPTVNSFNRFFKRITGVSPKEFLKSLN